MLRSKSLDINGLVLKGDEPITPRTNAFLTQHNMNVQQANGFVTLTGNFSVSKSEVDAFLAQKKTQDEVAASKNNTVVSPKK